MKNQCKLPQDWGLSYSLEAPGMLFDCGMKLEKIHANTMLSVLNVMIIFFC